MDWIWMLLIHVSLQNLSQPKKEKEKEKKKILSKLVWKEILQTFHTFFFSVLF